MNSYCVGMIHPIYHANKWLTWSHNWREQIIVKSQASNPMMYGWLLWLHCLVLFMWTIDVHYLCNETFACVIVSRWDKLVTWFRFNVRIIAALRMCILYEQRVLRVVCSLAFNALYLTLYVLQKCWRIVKGFTEWHCPRVSQSGSSWSEYLSGYHGFKICLMKNHSIFLYLFLSFRQLLVLALCQGFSSSKMQAILTDRRLLKCNWVANYFVPSTVCC